MAIIVDVATSSRSDMSGLLTLPSTDAAMTTSFSFLVPCRYDGMPVRVA
jgi:hypothetical protein